MMRGRIAQAPMSQPANPTLLNRNATLAPTAASRISEAIATIAPAPAQMPSTAAMTGCGQARIALTRSPGTRLDQIAGHARERGEAFGVHLHQRADDLEHVAAG